MTCESAVKELSLLLYGELGFEEEELLQQHLDGCVACREALEREKRLHAMADASEQPVPVGLLAQCRRQLRSETLAAAGPVRGAWWARLRSAFAGHPVAWSPLAATALLTIGFLAGKFIGSGMPAPSSSDSFSRAGLGPVASRVRYVEPSDSGQVQIVVEETRERRLSGGLQDARIRQLLLEAAREADDPGLRVESMDILRAHTETAEVRRALLASLQQDPNPGVRLKALEGLKRFAGDPETQKTLARVVLSDENPGVRIQAIDLLTEHREPSMAGVFQELLEKEHNGYVRQRCERALRDMNASLETF